MTTPDQRQTVDELLGRAAVLRILALNVAANHRREVFHLQRKEGEGEYDGELGREVLADAKIYYAWLEDAGYVPFTDPAGSAS